MMVIIYNTWSLIPLSIEVLFDFSYLVLEYLDLEFHCESQVYIT